MAGKGNTRPKPAEQRRRANAPPKSKTVKADAVLRGIDLPFGFDWHSQTRIWWDNWRRSAQAVRFTATDWDFLLDTAMLHTEFWNGDTSVGPELRLRVSKLGATEDDRARLHIEIAETDDKPKPAPKSLKQRKGLIMVKGGKAS
jgi:hypothetical protein